MEAERIDIVDLDLRRHALLMDENLEADRRYECACLVPGHDLDSRHDAKSIIAA
jgi:hypothetical protein